MASTFYGVNQRVLWPPTHGILVPQGRATRNWAWPLRNYGAIPEENSSGHATCLLPRLFNDLGEPAGDQAEIVFSAPKFTRLPDEKAIAVGHDVDELVRTLEEKARRLRGEGGGRP